MRPLARLYRHGPLGLALTGLVVGAVLALAGADRAADIAWAVPSGVLAARLLFTTVQSLVRREPDVDVIALLAICGALATGETLAAAIIAVMLTGGEALEEAAGRRAERELSALLATAPRVAHRVANGSLEDIAVEDVAVGDELVVKPGEVVPVDGLLAQTAT